MPHVALTIAGSDSGGGAGVQADLKTFAALGVYGASVITALTAQNTVTVAGVHPVPPDFVTLQIDTVIEDIPVNAVKTGMLFDAAIIEAVAASLEKHGVGALVVDPVMVAKSGDRLLEPDAVEAMTKRLLPLALVVTPNIPEAETLADMKIENRDGMKRAAERILGMGPHCVVVKGGHMRGGTLIDLLVTTEEDVAFERKRIDTTHTHGTGCTFSAAIAAGLARGLSLHDAVAEAVDYIAQAIAAAEPLGKGHGPVNHFHRFF